MRIIKKDFGIYWYVLVSVAMFISRVGLSFAENQIQSVWTSRPVILDGIFREAEWNSASIGLGLKNGWMLVKNDNRFLYLLIDLNGDTFDDPPKQTAPWGDFVSLSFDVNRDEVITPNIDSSYGIYPGSYRAGVQYYLGSGVKTELRQTSAKFVAGFGPTIANIPPHRIWEIAIPLNEIAANAGQPVKLGIKTYSETPQFSDTSPANFTADFSDLTMVELAQSSTPVATTSTEEPMRAINTEGKVQVNNPDGTIEIRYPGGRTIIYPNGERRSFTYYIGAPVAIPPSIPDNDELNWLNDHSERLLNIVRLLVGNDETQINNYLEHEGTDINLYEKILNRRSTIEFIVSP